MINVTRSLNSRHIAKVVILLVLMAGVLPNMASAQFEGPAAQDVRAREIAFAQTLADRDLEAFVTFVAPDAVFFSGNTPLRGRDAVEAAWSRYFEGEVAPFSWVPDLVQVLESGDLALSSGPVTSAAGEASGRFNSIWRKGADGQWRVVFDKGS